MIAPGFAAHDLVDTAIKRFASTYICLIEQDDYVRALVDGESLCKELAEAAGDEEAANAGLEKARISCTYSVYSYVYSVCILYMCTPYVYLYVYSLWKAGKKWIGYGSAPRA